MAGRQILSDKWNDEILTAELVWALPDQFTTLTRQEDLQRGLQILRSFDSLYMRRCGRGGLFRNPNETDIPTPEEWREAVEKSKTLQDATWSSYRPFLLIAKTLSDACLEGVLQSASRAPAGGAFIDLDWSEWNSEGSWLRFETCRINSENAFEKLKNHSSEHWIFFEGALFEKWLADISQQDQGQPDKDTPTPDEIRLSRKAGRPSDYDWSGFTAEVRRRYLNNELQGSARAITASMLEWCNENWGRVPTESRVRAKIDGMLDAFDLAYKSD